MIRYFWAQISFRHILHDLELLIHEYNIFKRFFADVSWLLYSIGPTIWNPEKGLYILKVSENIIFIIITLTCAEMSSKTPS